MNNKQNIFLVGPMGAGKSTIGKALAEITNYDLFDSDSEIEKRTGADIAWVFDVEGEEGFRKREAAVIDDLTKMNGIILATGGGTVKLKENRNHLISRGVVVYLETSVEKQFSRTSSDKRRPLLNNPDPKGTLERLLKERDPLYREVADIVVKTDDLTAKEIAKQIIEEMENI